MHKSVVTCGSEYFRAMLEHEMAESASGAVELEQVSPRVLGRVVRWLYTGELGAISDVGEGLALLEGSRFLRVERMETQCSAWLCAQVNASTCVEVWAEANRMGYEAVEACALRVVGRNFVGVTAGPHFLGLAREALLELLRSEELSVRSEQAVYEAVMGWVRHDVGSRKAWLGEMLGAVRMELLPPEYLAETVGADPLVTESVEALRIFAGGGSAQPVGRRSTCCGGERRAAARKHANIRVHRSSLRSSFSAAVTAADNTRLIPTPEITSPHSGTCCPRRKLCVQLGERRPCRRIRFPASLHHVIGLLRATHWPIQPLVVDDALSDGRVVDDDLPRVLTIRPQLPQEHSVCKHVRLLGDLPAANHFGCHPT